ncbi:MAG: hypothetical protein ACK46G_15620 [Flavobacteriales bacterium]
MKACLFRTLSILSAVLVLMTTNAQVPEQLQPFIQFADEREAESFSRVLGTPNTADIITLLMLTDSGLKGPSLEEVMRRIQASTERHRGLSAASLSEKQLRHLFQEVQSAFMKRYDARALFADLFANGDFNCVTASMLFAIILNDLGIPFDMHQTPDHMFLVTTAGGYPAMIETTDPVRGVFVVSPRTQKKYVEELLRAKRITQAQIDSMGMVGAVSTISRLDTVIDMRAAVGTHYHNAGIFIADSDVQKAISMFAKAHALHPSATSKATMRQALAMRLDKMEFETMDDVRFLLAGYSFIDDPEVDAALLDDQSKLLDRHLIQRGDTVFAKAMFDAFLNTVDRERTRNKLTLQHHVAMGRYYALKNLWNPAVEHLLLAAAMEPNNVEVEAWVSEALLRRLERMPDRSSYLEHLDGLVERAPELKGTPGIQRCYHLVYLISAEDHFNIDQRTKAEDYLKRFERTYGQQESLPVDAIAGAYLAGWRSWTRARDKSMAKSYLARGLKIAPFNEDLNRANGYTTY